MGGGGGGETQRREIPLRIGFKAAAARPLSQRRKRPRRSPWRVAPSARGASRPGPMDDGPPCLGWPSDADSGSRDPRLGDSAEMSDSATRRLGDLGLIRAVTRSQGRMPQDHYRSHCSCASSLSQANILSSLAPRVAATVLLFESTYISLSMVAGSSLFLISEWMCP